MSSGTFRVHGRVLSLERDLELDDSRIEPCEQSSNYPQDSSKEEVEPIVVVNDVSSNASVVESMLANLDHTLNECSRECARILQDASESINAMQSSLFSFCLHEDTSVDSLSCLLLEIDRVLKNSRENHRVTSDAWGSNIERLVEMRTSLSTSLRLRSSLSTNSPAFSSVSSSV